MRDIRIGSLSFRTGTRRQLFEMLSRPRSPGAASALCIGFLNPHAYNRAVEDSRAEEFLKGCDFVCLDGIGILAAGKLFNRGPLERLVMDQVFDAAIRDGLLHGRALVLGLSREENAAAASRIREAAPGLEIVEGMHGFLADPGYVEILEKHADIDFVLVGMGSPKSEAVLNAARRICTRAVCWHVGGGTLRNWAGSKRRAPGAVSRAGLEWVHRMIFEPETRERYIRGIPAFVRNIAAGPYAIRNINLKE